MSRAGVRGARRTRVYDCNYNMGESYYKPALDRMDRKYSGKPELPEPRLRSSIFDDPDLLSPPEETLFDSRGARAPRGRPLSTAIEEEFDDEISASLKRLRANKKSSRFAEDLEFDTSLANIESRTRLSDKLLESAGITPEMSGARRALIENEERTEKRIARRLKDEDNSMTRWTALKSSTSEEESSAAQRARASRARLSDLEDEMTERSDRLAAREQRAARLRALVADTDSTDVTSSKLSLRSEKKQVTF